MSSLKNEWKQTGEDLVHALEQLGKTLTKSIDKGVRKATAWAYTDDAVSQQQEPPKTEQTDGDASKPDDPSDKTV